MAEPRFVTCTESDVPDGDDWLGPRERVVLASLRSGPRRASWRLGRWTAKLLLAAPDEAPARVEILREPDGSPRPYRDGAPLDVTLSISHRAGRGLAATAPGQVALGCDLERIEPRSPAFVADFFTAREAEAVAVAAEPELVANLIWSAKEAALKALRVGLGRDTRELEVDFTPDGRLAVDDAGGGAMRGSWRRDGRDVLTFVVAPGTPRSRDP